MVCVVRPLKATTHDVSPCRRRLHASCCAHVGWTRPRVGSVLRPRQTDRPSGPREVKQRTSTNRALVQTAESDASYCTEDMLVAAYQPIETNVLQHQMAVREWAAVYAVSSPFTLLARLSREIAVPTPTAPRRRQTWGGRRSAVRAAKNAWVGCSRRPRRGRTTQASRSMLIKLCRGCSSPITHVPARAQPFFFRTRITQNPFSGARRRRQTGETAGKPQPRRCSCCCERGKAAAARAVVARAAATAAAAAARAADDGAKTARPQFRRGAISRGSFLRCVARAGAVVEACR